MGRPKGLESVDGVPMLRAHVLRAREAGLRPRVVLGVHAASCLSVLPPGVEVRWSGRASREDMSASAALGLEGLPWALLTPVDVPPASLRTLGALLHAARPCVPTFGGVEGHPVRVHAEPDGTHPCVRLDLRLREALRVPVDDPAVTRDLDTPADWDAWRAMPGRPRAG